MKSENNNSANTTLIKMGVPTIQVMQPEALSEENFCIIDVRRPDEFTGELGHIEGAQLATLGPELDHFLQKLLLSSGSKLKLLFACRSGARSATATMQALELGFEVAYNMEGGMILWNERGFKTTTA